ncbi:MAG TPA: hypothetical protein VE732_03845 [Nitrososphaera sp.]|nr:hypothetical protein [Nitrososphaera sp.]
MKLRQIYFILVAACLCLLTYQPCRAQTPTEEEFDWVNQHFYTVLEELLPIKERLGFSLGYRSYRDLYTDELEYSFGFNRIIQEKYLTVVVRMPDSVSLYDQIMSLHRKNPSESIESIKSKLKIKEWRLSEEKCPAVRRQFDAFYRLNLEMLSAKDRAEQARGSYTITLHPRVDTFYADISGGDMQLELTDSGHSYVRWAKSTQSALEICAKTGERQNGK